jgi:hypothetical protein
MNIEDVVELHLTTGAVAAADHANLTWHPYNPRKSNNRFGCSITSLDGGVSGVPDLDSLKEYNADNGTTLTELSFKTPTIYGAPFKYLFDNMSIGRSHYIRLDAGGFFPWHRDPDSHTFRLIYTVRGCTQDSLVWINDDRILDLHDRKWYIINTKKKHCVFSLKESTFAVFNVADTIPNWQFLYKHFAIK